MTTSEPSDAPPVALPVAKQTLANGLDVLVHEDRTCPIVAVNLWYHVGSKNERPGRTGFAHLFEHLMFEGSAHYDHGFFKPLQEAGAALNGSTNADRTNYWEVVPTGALELALWMESDRMGYLLPALSPAKFDNQRDVVLNERRQNYENRPYGLAAIALGAALYPPDHPYHWPTIGAPSDLRAASLEDVQAFFRAYYHPSNASLALAGDLTPDEGFALADRYFGEIEARARRRSRQADRISGRPTPARAGGSHRAPTALSRLALAGAFRRRRCGTGSGSRSSGQRQDIPALSCPRVRAAHCRRRRRRAGFARNVRSVPGDRHRSVWTRSRRDRAGNR